MGKFYQKVDLRSKKAMIKFLSEHFRYNTMNSWNLSTSYAHNVKINRVIPQEMQDKAYELMEQGGVYDTINMDIRDFDVEHNHLYQAGFNGRSGGYLVLYQGSKKPLDYKTRCNECGKLTWYEDGHKCEMEGCSGILKELKEPVYQIGCYAGRAIDQDKDYDDWSMSSLRERVVLVQDFDRLCDDVVGEVIYCCEHYNIIEKEITVPKTIKVLQRVV